MLNLKTEEKLKEFLRLAEEEAELKRRKNLKEINIKIKEAANKGIIELEAISKSNIDKEFNKLTKIKNKKLLEEKNKVKISLINLRMSYIENIFNNIEKELYIFTKTEQYKNYLIQNINKICNSISEIYLTKEDMIHVNLIKKEIDTSINIVESDEDFIGGFKGLMLNKKVIVDYSFKSRLLNEKEKFNGFKII